MAACGCSRVIAQMALDSFCSPEVKLTMPHPRLTNERERGFDSNSL